MGIDDPDAEGPILGTDFDVFVPDSDTSSQTDPLNPDSDGDGNLDGDEDVNQNGQLDDGESDPNVGITLKIPATIWSLRLMLPLVLVLIALGSTWQLRSGKTRFKK